MSAITIIGRASLPLLLASISYPEISTAASDIGTLTVAVKDVGCPGFGVLDWSGYANGTMVSYSPTGLTGGKTVDGVYDAQTILHCSVSLSESVFSVTGFSSNPGSSWLTSVECNGVTNLQSAESAYSYSGGQVTWNWSQRFGLRAKSGSNVSCTVVHN